MSSVGDDETPETAASLCAYLKAKPGTTEAYPFGPGTQVFKVGGKMFALVRFDKNPLRANFKVVPEENEVWRARHPKTILPGYHRNRFHGSTLVLDGTVPTEEVHQIFDRSYELVVHGLTKEAKQALRTGNEKNLHV